MKYKVANTSISKPHSEHISSERAIEELHKQYLRGKRYNIYVWSEYYNKWKLYR